MEIRKHEVYRSSATNHRFDSHCRAKGKEERRAAAMKRRKARLLEKFRESFNAEVSVIFVKLHKIRVSKYQHDTIQTVHVEGEYFDEQPNL